jgi:arsenate reductase
MAGKRCSTAPARRFRALSDADKQGLDAGKAIALMLAQPSMIKRPVLDLGTRRLVGFNRRVGQSSSPAVPAAWLRRQ